MSDEYQQRLPPVKMLPIPVKGPPRQPTREEKDTFLEHVALGASLNTAASRVGLGYMSFLREQEADPQFKQDIEIAKAARGGALLEIALEQCTVGVDEVLTHQGRIMYEYPNGYALDDTGNVTPDTVRVPVSVKKLVTSNPMLLAFLKALYPKQFTERLEVSNPNAPPATSIDEEARRTLEAVQQDLLALQQLQKAKPLDEEEI